MIIKNLSIKKLTLCIFITTYIIFFIITSFNIYSFSLYEFEKTKNLIINNTENLSNQISTTLNNFIDISKYPLIIPETDNLNNILTSKIKYDITDFNFMSYICQMMLIQNNSINGVYLYNLNGNGIYASRNIPNDQLKNPCNEKWFIDTIKSDKAVLITSNITFSNIFSGSSNDNSHLIAITRKIMNLQTRQISGILMITIPADEMKKILLNQISFKNQTLCIYDENSHLIASTHTPIQNELNSKFLNVHLSSQNTNIITESTNNIICSNRIEELNWCIINSIPTSSINKISSFYLFSFASNLIFYLILFVIIYTFFSKRVFTPLNYLIDNMNKRTDCNLNCQFEYNKTDEIGILIESYNDMKDRISNLIDINYKTKIDQKEIELKQLQNQINPHFIYNTLESIHMMAELNDDAETSIMSEYFGAIIRYSMNRKINTVTLKEEMQIIDNYIYLQKIRFDTLFTIDNVINNDIADCQIIKMIIQPLIENAIYHGLSQCDGNGKIIIQGMHIEDNLILTVTDNGIGIEDEKLHLLNDYINDKNNCFNGIALKNINKRLKLNYGNEYGLEIFSVVNIGTSMVLTLPYIIT